MSEYQQDTMCILTCSVISLLFCTFILLDVGWITFVAIYAIFSALGCLWGAYRIFFSKTNIY